MPPLLLDDDEAVAVGVGLRAAAAGSVTGIEETSLRAMTKLEQTLPARLRHRLDALRRATVSAVGRRADRRRRDARGHRRRLPRPRAAALRLPGARRRGQRAPRRAAPPRLHRSPLVPARLGPRPRGLADVPCRPDPAAPAHRAAVHPARTARGRREPRHPRASARWRGSTRRGSASTRRPRSSPSSSRPRRACCARIGEHSCVLETGSDSLRDLVRYLTSLDAAFEVLDPPELRTLLRELADRYAAAAVTRPAAAGD